MSFNAGLLSYYSYCVQYTSLESYKKHKYCIFSLELKTSIWSLFRAIYLVFQSLFSMIKVNWRHLSAAHTHTSAAPSVRATLLFQRRKKVWRGTEKSFFMLSAYCVIYRKLAALSCPFLWERLQCRMDYKYRHDMVKSWDSHRWLTWLKSICIVFSSFYFFFSFLNRKAHFEFIFYKKMLLKLL